MSLKKPSYVPNPKRLPSPTGAQTVSIRPGSAMAVIGAFVEIVRARFTPENQLPWVWTRDPKAAGPGNILIESAFNEDTEVKNFKPAIFIDRDEQTRGRTVLGDVAGRNRQTGTVGFFALDTLPIMMECVAAKKTESAIIADLTAVFLHASSDLIQAAFGFHEMTPVNTGRTQPFTSDKEKWVTPVTFNVQFPLRWTNTPIAPRLQEIVTRIAIKGGTSQTATDAYLTNIAQGTWLNDDDNS